jgi:hypothetical protein
MFASAGGDGNASANVYFGTQKIGSVYATGAVTSQITNALVEINLFSGTNIGMFGYWKFYSGTGWSNWSGLTFTGAEQLKFETVVSQNTTSFDIIGSISIDWVRYSTLSGTQTLNNYITSSGTQTAGSIYSNIITYNSFSDATANSSIVCNTSYDSGINYGTDVKNDLSVHSNIGSHIKSRFIFKGKNYISNYANMWNIYD